MRNNARLITLAVLAGVVGLVLGGAGMWIVRPLVTAGQVHTDEHDDHDADSHDENAEADDHSDHDDGDGDNHSAHDDEDDDDHAGHDGHDDDDGGGDAEVVTLTSAQREAFGISIRLAGEGSLKQAVKVPGQIAVNADRVTHIVPSAAGVARWIGKALGDTVEAGEVLAILESAEVSDAKTQYLAKLNELSCCNVDLTRANGLNDTTGELVALLDSSPTLDQLQATEFAELGKGHSELISAYAELAFVKSEYERERTLRDQNISSKADFQAAANAYKKAYAEYAALRGTLAFETTRAKSEARRSRQNAELETTAAERKLRVMGLTAEEVASLREVLSAIAIVRPAPEAACTDPNCNDCDDHAAPPEDNHACTDPNCSDCDDHDSADVATPGVDGQRLGTYSLRAPFGGTIIEKHISLGEKLSDDSDVFTIADMSTVWVELNLYQKDLPYIREGQSVVISAGDGVPQARGALSYISSIMDETTRTIPARVVLNNENRVYRPGLFVTARIPLGETHESVVIPREAVQRIGEQPCVFVPEDGGFEPVAVVLGHTDGASVEIVTGLKAGQRYVAKGAFELKAHMVTASLDSHAGHGH